MVVFAGEEEAGRVVTIVVDIVCCSPIKSPTTALQLPRKLTLSAVRSRFKWARGRSSKEVAMANKQNFKPEEWTKILESTMLAGMAVSAAEPSGLLGALKEAIASSSTLARAQSDAASNELVKAVVSDFETKEGRAAVQEALRQQLAGAKKPGDVVQRSLDNLKEVSAILNAKAPQDAAGFKAWLQTISKNVAEASSEGGFLGIGGVKVSDAEKATLADISKALG
jgi:hypothetical protein